MYSELKKLIWFCFSLWFYLKRITEVLFIVWTWQWSQCGIAVLVRQEEVSQGRAQALH